MPEKLKELLEKINQEGIKKAEENTKTIESKAKTESEKIIEDAKNQAKKIIEDAKNQAKKTKETTELALKHSSRDLLLSLKDEIKKIFNKIISSETKKSLTSEDLAVILKALIEKYIKEDGKVSDIRILLNKDDLGKLKNNFLSKLKEKIKEGIEIKSSQNIKSGFSISFDKGKSFFDFTDEGLLEALSAYLNPEISKLFK